MSDVWQHAEPAVLPLRPQDDVECRACEVHCDKVVYPSACLDRSCPFVYAYEEHGHTFMGCMQKVFEVEIDLDMLRAAEARRDGFGAVKAMRRPLPMCRSEVEPCYEQRDGRARVRQSRVQRAAGGIADVSGLRPARRSLGARATAASDAGERPDRREREREPPRRRRRPRRTPAAPPRRRRRAASAGSRARRRCDAAPAASAAAANASPFHVMLEHAGDDERRDERRQRRVDERGDRGGRDREHDADDAQRARGACRAGRRCGPSRCARRWRAR